MALPIGAAAAKLGISDAAYKEMENQLDFGQKCIESVLKGGEEIFTNPESSEDVELPVLKGVTAHGSVLRELHSWLKDKDPALGGLVRVQNKRKEFLWVHPQFEREY